MSGRGRGGRGGVSSTRGAATTPSARATKQLNDLTSTTGTRSGSRSPARAGRRESPARGNPQFNNRGGRGSNSRGSANSRGRGGSPAATLRGKQRAQAVKQAAAAAVVLSPDTKITEPAEPQTPPPLAAATAASVNVRKTKMPKIKENPDAPEMSDMQDIRASKAEMLTSSSSSDDSETETVNGETAAADSEMTTENGHDHVDDDGKAVTSASHVASAKDSLTEAKGQEEDESLKNDLCIGSSDNIDTSSVNKSDNDDHKAACSDAAAANNGDIVATPLVDETDVNMIDTTTTPNDDKTEEKNICDDKSSALISAKDQGKTSLEQDRQTGTFKAGVKGRLPLANKFAPPKLRFFIFIQIKKNHGWEKQKEVLL